jgi:hypothetical protein
MPLYHMKPEKLSERFRLDGNNRVDSYFGESVNRIQGCRQDPIRLVRESAAPAIFEEVKTLIRKNSAVGLDISQEVTVEATFFQPYFC